VAVVSGVSALFGAFPFLGVSAEGAATFALGSTALGGTATILGSTLVVEGITDKNPLRDFLGQDNFDFFLAFSTYGSSLAVEQMSSLGWSPGGSKGTGTAGPGEKIPSKAELPQSRFTTEKLQHEFKHSQDFGIPGKWNKSAGGIYQSTIESHINVATDVFKSTYRGQDVYVYINKGTGLGAYTDLSGNYIGGWKFSEAQINFHVTNGIQIKK